MRLAQDAMTATERFEAIITRSEHPDRIPVHLMGIPEYSMTRLQFNDREDELLEHDPFFHDESNMLFTPLGDMTLAYFLGAEDAMCSTGYLKDFELVLDRDGTIVHDDGERQRLLARDEGEMVNYKGRRNGWCKLDTGHRYTWFIDGYLKSKETITAWFDEHGWPHEHPVKRVDRETVTSFQSCFGDRMFLNGGINRSGLFEETWFMMGFDTFATMSVKDPGFLHDVVDKMLEADLNAVDALKPLHFTCIYVSDDLGQKGRSLISPRTFRTFFKEPYTELFGAIHDTGAKVFMHSCGNIVDLLPDLVEAGLDGWQSLEVPAGIDHAAVKKRFGDDLILIGGIDSSRVLTFGTAEEIDAHVQQQARAMGEGGGYIAGPAHDYLKVPLESALAMRDALHRHGRYPLQ